MISIDEALRQIKQHVPLIDEIVVPIAESAGCVLRETILSDVDSPPFDKAVVDGFAVVSSDLAANACELQVTGEVAAGEVPERRLQSGRCMRIMTGAPIPAGADAVVMIEESSWWNPEGPPGEASSSETVELRAENVTSGRNILPQGTSIRRGEAVLSQGRQLRAADVGLLAEVGQANVRVSRPPRVAILATGNELLPCGLQPGPGQIRNSNGPLLAALVRELGGQPIELGIAQDDPEKLRLLIERGLQADLLLLSGGVSAGAYDFVPSVLEAVGMQAIFHKVKIKPGKPLLFGTVPRSAPGALPTVVFGLPGNPVSSLVGFQRFVRPAIGWMLGQPADEPPAVQGRLAVPFSHRGGRPTYWPARVETREGELMVEPLKWRGSADQRTVAAANALAFFPEEPREYTAGETVELFGWHPTPIF